MVPNPGDTSQLNLADASLLNQRAWIDGRWCDADSAATFPIINPATGTELAQVARCGQAETRRAIAAAAAALPAWRQTTAAERARLLRRWYELMLTHEDDLARILTAEQGKPLAEARGEIIYGASF